MWRGWETLQYTLMEMSCDILRKLCVCVCVCVWDGEETLEGVGHPVVCTFLAAKKLVACGRCHWTYTAHFGCALCATCLNSFLPFGQSDPALVITEAPMEERGLSRLQIQMGERLRAGKKRARKLKQKMAGWWVCCIWCVCVCVCVYVMFCYGCVVCVCVGQRNRRFLSMRLYNRRPNQGACLC